MDLGFFSSMRVSCNSLGCDTRLTFICKQKRFRLPTSVTGPVRILAKDLKKILGKWYFHSGSLRYLIMHYIFKCITISSSCSAMLHEILSKWFWILRFFMRAVCAQEEPPLLDEHMNFN